MKSFNVSSVIAAVAVLIASAQSSPALASIVGPGPLPNCICQVYYTPYSRTCVVECDDNSGNILGDDTYSLVTYTECAQDAKEFEATLGSKWNCSYKYAVIPVNPQ